MRSRILLACAAGVLALTATACGDDDDDDAVVSDRRPATEAAGDRSHRRPTAPATEPPATDAPATDPPATDAPSRCRPGQGRLRHQVPGRVLHRHGGRRPGLRRRQRGDRDRVLLVRVTGRRRLPDRPDRRRRRQGIRRDGDHPDGQRRDPSTRCCRRQRTGDRARRQRPRRLHQEDGRGSDRQRRRRAARRRVPEVGPQGRRHDRADGRCARRACARCSHPGREGRTRRHRRRDHHRWRRDQVRLGPGCHRGRGPADPRAQPDGDLLGLRRPGDRRRQGRQGSGQAGHGRRLRRAARPPPRRSSTAT